MNEPTFERISDSDLYKLLLDSDELSAKSIRILVIECIRRLMWEKIISDN